MPRIGVREFKARAGELVRQACETSIVVTVDGRAMARLKAADGEDATESRKTARLRFLDRSERLANRVSALWPEGPGAAEVVAELRQ